MRRRPCQTILRRQSGFPVVTLSASPDMQVSVTAAPVPRARFTSAAHPLVPDRTHAFTYALRRGLRAAIMDIAREERPSLKRKSAGGEVRERPNRTHC